jgi:DNA modification methylase
MSFKAASLLGAADFCALTRSEGKMSTLEIEYKAVRDLRPYPRNARTHSRKQIKQIASSITEFGFCNPILVDDNNEIIAGHGRVEAAKLLQIETVPTVALSHMTPAQQRAYVLADNKLALNAGWDRDILALELQNLIELDIDISVTGFESAEVDIVLGEAADKARDPGPEDEIPEPVEGPAVTRRGDVWVLGSHRLICGDARDEAVYKALLGKEEVDLMFTDPPYNVKIDGHVSGLGRTKHAEFAFASGEMSEAEFTTFLAAFMVRAKESSRDGAIHYICMDDVHAYELLTAARQVGLTLKATCTWAKSNGGMGSLYRKQCEFVHVFKVGDALHVNNVELGRHGRNRTTLWQYAGVNTFRKGRMDELTMHPTVKPVALVADAILDCSKQKDIVLDPFCGSGTSLIAAEKTGRRGRGIEYEPRYCDVIVRRWRSYTGKEVTLAATGRTFEDMAEERQNGPLDSPLLAAE